MYYKSVLIKLAIFAIGAATGFFAAKKIYEEYYAAIAQEEIDSVKEAFEHRQDIRLRTPYSEDNGMSDEEYEEKNITGEECSASVNERTNRNALTRSSLDGNLNEQAKRNYNLVGAKHEEPDENEVVEEGPLTDAAGKTEQEMDLTQVDRTLPYIIDDREFTEEFDHHDKISLYYYRVDDVLCDEHEEVIEDVEDKVGYDALAQLDTQTTVWVRNEPLCIDYEIISINKSFAEAVHGVGIAEKNLSPRERYLRNQRRRENNEE